MNIILDLLGASLIGGTVMYLIMNLNIYTTNTKYVSDSELHLQQNAKTLAELLNHDLRKIGYKPSGNAIISAEPKSIAFYSDIDSNGVVDVVKYMLSDSTDVSSTGNPSDKVLWRIINGDSSKGPSLGITDLQFTYRNSSGAETTALDSIKFIKAEFWVESPELVDDDYLFTYWEMTINPRNL